MTARRRWILAARAATRAGRALARTGYPKRAAVYYGCVCIGFGDFPTECYRDTEATTRARALLAPERPA